MMRLLLALALLCAPSAAHAGPLGALIPIVIGAVAKSVALKIFLTVALTVAVAGLQRVLKGRQRPPGIQTERKLTGGVVSRRFILGMYCTAGSEVTPPMSGGTFNKTPNAYLTYVTAISDIPIAGITKVILNGEIFDVDYSTADPDGYGNPIGGAGTKYFGSAWVRFHDGRQTTADATLVSKFAGYVRPWTAQHVGKGVAYAVPTFYYNPDVFKSEPEIKYVVNGISLYDPRQDSSVGGSGGHVWNDPTTWTVTHNNIVMIYNILRGITFADGSKWGGECEASDLPLANWVAGMNVCDETITTETGSEPRYRAGYEVIVGEMQPADVIEELLKGCNADISEVGGIYKVRVGPPSLPVMFFTDDDFLVNREQDYNPYPGIQQAHNTILASYPSPDEGWQPHDAPAITNQDYIDEDDGQEITASLAFNAVPYPVQVQRLMTAYLQDERRYRQHGASFGHYAFVLEPLDSISWTSERNGYIDKIFELASTSENLMTLANLSSMREADPTDYDWTSDQQLPDPVNIPTWELPDVQGVPGFDVQPMIFIDNDGDDRRSGIRILWDEEAAIDANILSVEIREKESGQLSDVFTTSVAPGQAQRVALPDTVYQVRAMFVVNRPVEWTDWLEVLTPAVLLGVKDIGIDVVDLGDLVTNFNGRNDRDPSTPVNVTIPLGGTCIDHTVNADGSIDISFEWNGYSSTNQAKNDFIEIALYSSTSPSTYIIGTAASVEERWLVKTDTAGTYKRGLPANRYYTFGARVVRIVDPDIDTDQTLVSAWVQSGVSGENPYHPPTQNAASGDITTTINGVSASNVALTYTNFNARNDRLGTTPIAPVVPGGGAAVDHTVNSNGSIDMSFEWTYSGNEKDNDAFEVLLYASTSSAAYTPGATPAAEFIARIGMDRRAVIFQGLPAGFYYTWAVRTIRQVDRDVAIAAGNLTDDILRSAWVKSGVAAENPYHPPTQNAASGDITTTISGRLATTIAGTIDAAGIITANKVTTTSIAVGAVTQTNSGTFGYAQGVTSAFDYPDYLMINQGAFINTNGGIVKIHAEQLIYLEYDPTIISVGDIISAEFVITRHPGGGPGITETLADYVTSGATIIATAAILTEHQYSGAPTTAPAYGDKSVITVEHIDTPVGGFYWYAVFARPANTMGNGAIRTDDRQRMDLSEYKR